MAYYNSRKKHDKMEILQQRPLVPLRTIWQDVEGAGWACQSPRERWRWPLVPFRIIFQCIMGSRLAWSVSERQTERLSRSKLINSFYINTDSTLWITADSVLGTFSISRPFECHPMSSTTRDYCTKPTNGFQVTQVLSEADHANNPAQQPHHPSRHRRPRPGPHSSSDSSLPPLQTAQYSRPDLPCPSHRQSHRTLVRHRTRPPPYR